MPKDLLLNGASPPESNQGSSARNHPNIFVKNIT
jgi:hypothetical protein